MTRSAVWLYFCKVGDGSKVQCLKCHNVYKYNKSTTSLSCHLRAIHQIHVANARSSGVTVEAGEIVISENIESSENATAVSTLLECFKKNECDGETEELDGFEDVLVEEHLEQPPTTSKRKRKFKTEYSKVDIELNPLQRDDQQSRSRDEHDVFAEGVAIRLRKIRNEYTLLQLQRNIDNLLYDALISQQNNV